MSRINKRNNAEKMHKLLLKIGYLCSLLSGLLLKLFFPLLRCFNFIVCLNILRFFMFIVLEYCLLKYRLIVLEFFKNFFFPSCLCANLVLWRYFVRISTKYLALSEIKVEEIFMYLALSETNLIAVVYAPKAGTRKMKATKEACFRHLEAQNRANR